jgi:hypothetical protein
LVSTYLQEVSVRPPSAGFNIIPAFIISSRLLKKKKKLGNAVDDE